MLYWLLYLKLFHYFPPFRIFRYLTFRTAFASLTALFTALIVGPMVINRLREFQIGQYIREEGPKAHQKKAGTPTMGGLLIAIAIVVPTLAVGRPEQPLRLDRGAFAPVPSPPSDLPTTTSRWCTGAIWASRQKPSWACRLPSAS